MACLPIGRPNARKPHRTRGSGRPCPRLAGPVPQCVIARAAGCQDIIRRARGAVKEVFTVRRFSVLEAFLDSGGMYPGIRPSGRRCPRSPVLRQVGRAGWADDSGCGRAGSAVRHLRQSSSRAVRGSAAVLRPGVECATLRTCVSPGCSLVSRADCPVVGAAAPLCRGALLFSRAAGLAGADPDLTTSRGSHDTRR
jgi:hypothetical protein